MLRVPEQQNPHLHSSSLRKDSTPVSLVLQCLWVLLRLHFLCLGTLPCGSSAVPRCPWEYQVVSTCLQHIRPRDSCLWRRPVAMGGRSIRVEPASIKQVGWAGCLLPAVTAAEFPAVSAESLPAESHAGTTPVSVNVTLS